MGRVSDAKERLMRAIIELIWVGSYGKTTVDQICAKAGVKKGSFYYFFDSKADLAEAALDVEWAEFRPKLDVTFSPTVPPLERLRDYCRLCYQEQVELKAQFGYVLGCPLCTLGTEVSTQERGLQRKVKSIMDQVRLYLETAVRDADATDAVEAPDAEGKSRILFAYYEGLLTQARIRNDVTVLRDMFRGTLDILRVEDALVAAR